MLDHEEKIAVLAKGTKFYDRNNDKAEVTDVLDYENSMIDEYTQRSLEGKIKHENIR